MSIHTGNYHKTNDFNNIVLGRRSVKVYDPEVKISREEMSEILRSLRYFMMLTMLNIWTRFSTNQ